VTRICFYWYIQWVYCIYDLDSQLGQISKTSKGSMIGRNFIVKDTEIFLNIAQKFRLHKNSLPLTWNRQKTEMTSLSYDVNDNIYSKSKSIYFCTDLANIEVTRILISSSSSSDLVNKMFSVVLLSQSTVSSSRAAKPVFHLEGDTGDRRQ